MPFYAYRHTSISPVTWDCTASPPGLALRNTWHSVPFFPSDSGLGVLIFIHCWLTQFQSMTPTIFFPVQNILLHNLYGPIKSNRKHSKFLSYMLKNIHFSILYLIIPPPTTTILSQFLGARHCSKHGTWMTWFGLCSTTMNGKYYILFNIWGKWDPEWLSNWLKIFKVDQI